MPGAFETRVEDAIRRAFPTLTSTQLSHAVDAFLGYIEIANEICDAIAAYTPPITAIALTADVQEGTVEGGLALPSSQEPPPTDA